MSLKISLVETPFPFNFLCGNAVPMRSRPTTPLVESWSEWEECDRMVDKLVSLQILETLLFHLVYHFPMMFDINHIFLQTGLSKTYWYNVIYCSHLLSRLKNIQLLNRITTLMHI